MEDRPESSERQSNAYELFILVLTVYSLVVMVAMLLPWLSSATVQVLGVYDNVICLVFLLDFGLRMTRASSKRAYFIEGRGWLDLLGSIPSFGFFRFTALFRLARLSRLARIARLFRGKRRHELVVDVLANRGQYAVFVTFLAAFLVVSLSAVMVLQFESKSSAANIKTGGQALWWDLVTLTTVGYGDFFPVTTGGRIVAVVVMLAGVGIIASLASILARVMIPTDGSDSDSRELAEMRKQLDRVHLELGQLRQDLAGGRFTEPDSEQ